MATKKGEDKVNKDLKYLKKLNDNVKIEFIKNIIIQINYHK